MLAVDGTRFLLPNHPSVIKDFGQHGMGANGDCQRSMAIGSILYDVLNQIAIDAAMTPYASSESSVLLGHLPRIKEGDLLLLDRGLSQLLAATSITCTENRFLCQAKVRPVVASQGIYQKWGKYSVNTPQIKISTTSVS